MDVIDMSDIVNYRILGDMARTTTRNHFNELMQKDLFDSNEIIYYNCNARYSYRTLEEKEISETPAKTENVIL